MVYGVIKCVVQGKMVESFDERADQDMTLIFLEQG
jgi:hypothetical protein